MLSLLMGLGLSFYGSGTGRPRFSRRWQHLAILARQFVDQFLKAARFTEIALQAFLDAGLSDHQAICSMRVYLSYVRGSVLWEIGGFVAGYRASPMQRISPRVLADIDSLEENLFSQTRRLARTLISIDPERAFREGYDHILDTLMPKQRRRS